MQRIRLAVLAATLALTVSSLALPSHAQDLQTVKLNMFSPRRETTLGSDLGFFAQHGLQLDLSITHSSEQQAQELLDGVWDIAGADADDFIYWDQDKGADFFMFMDTQGTVDYSLWVTSDIQSFDDLRGKTLAVDSAYSGQSTMLRMMLQDHGLTAGQEVTFLPVGANRLPALLDGSAVGASLGSATASTDAGQSGQVHILAHGTDYLPQYPANPYATTRRWATLHPELMLGFIDAVIDTKMWLLDPANQQAAVSSIMRTDQVDQTHATALYNQAIGSIGDLSTATQVREDMIQLVEDERVSVGLMDSPTPPTSKFVTPAWYDLALQLRGGGPTTATPPPILGTPS